MSAHFEIRQGGPNQGSHGGVLEATHEWVALVGGNGETMMTSETYPISHGNAKRAVAEIVAAVEQAATAWTG
jgi:uncharacterized protein YegP (UPF0339 family)